MRIKHLLLTVPLLALAACQASATTELPAIIENTATHTPPLLMPTIIFSPTPVPQPSFTFIPPEEYSILPPSDLDAFSGKWNNLGGVVYHNGQFHMFYNNYHGFPPSEVVIGYAVSDDGYAWERASEGSVLSVQDLPWTAQSISCSDVIIERDGSWVMYFQTRDEYGSKVPARIGRATAKDPAGPWAIDPQPILEPDANAWDQFAVQRPTVVRTEEGYFMIYVGYDQDGTNPQFGLATSYDGVTWTKHDNPDTIEARYSRSDPVFTPADVGWGEDVQIRYPDLLLTEEGWLLFYRVQDDDLPGGSKMGFAASQDGLTWIQGQTKPLFTADQAEGFNALWVTRVVQVEGVYYLYMETAAGSSSYINMAIYEGPLLSEEAVATVPAVTIPNATPYPEDYPVVREDELGVVMVLVPAGSFVMGSDANYGNAPPHPVILSDYYIDQFEVTTALYAQFLNEVGMQSEDNAPWLDERASANHIHPVNNVWTVDPGFEDHPVVEVTWYGAKAFCEWRGMRLPSEAEWEKAARGTDGRTYPWGEEISCDLANYGTCRLGTTLPVTSLPGGVSPYGVFNMAGNAAEWTGDFFDAAYYLISPLFNPMGPGTIPHGTIASRGGSWYSTNQYLRTFHRNSEFSPFSHLANVGFRCVWVGVVGAGE